MKVPILWRLFAAWVTVFPLLMLNAVVRKALHGALLEALSILLFTALLSGLGRLYWVHVGSRVLVTARGVEITGLRPRALTWEEMHSIRVRLGRLRFEATDGRSIDVDPQRREFSTLLRLLPNQVRPELQTAAEQAVTRLKLPEHDL